MQNYDWSRVVINDYQRELQHRAYYEVASTNAPTVMYMAACIITNVPFERIENEDEYLKKRNPLAYAYSIKAEELINNITK